MGNSNGTSRETRTLYHFDRLPRSVRTAIANARFDWAIASWRKDFESGRLSAKDLCEHVHFADLRMSAKERLKVWGPDYPVLPGEQPTPTRKVGRRTR